MKVAWNATNQKKEKLVMKTKTCTRQFYYKYCCLWGCALWREDVDDNTQHNTTTWHHEEDVDNEMQSKKLRIQVCERIKSKKIEKNKHKV
jgi:hypothetical protein